MRQLARIVKIDTVSPIAKADAIEVARIGGWKVVVKKSEFSPGDLAVYFEIDSFLPQGNPIWQFLIDKAPFEFEGRRGHVLRSVTMRGQISQGLLLPLSVLKGASLAETPRAGLDVTAALGVLKYEPPVPQCLQGLVVGGFPSRVPKSDQERIQNLAEELLLWQQSELSWEVTEKLEGQSVTFFNFEGTLSVCARTWALAEVKDNPLWGIARALKIHEGLNHHAPGRSLALQGELVGPNIEGNIYRLKAPAFYLYDIYDADEGRYLPSPERLALAKELKIAHVPVIEESFSTSPALSMDALLAMADGFSLLKSDQRREGLVFKAREEEVSFKVVSNAYLTRSVRRAA